MCASFGADADELSRLQAVFAYGTKTSDLKPFYGAMFRDLLLHYTHWGWIDLDVILGDTTPLIGALRHHDVVTFPDGVCFRGRLAEKALF